MSNSVPADLRETINKCGQGHILEFLDAGKIAEKDIPDFINQLKKIDYPRLNSIYEATIKATQEVKSAAGDLVAVEEVLNVQSNKAEAEKLNKMGLDAIANNQIAAILLAGGQGTRLGFNLPKGEYNIGLPSTKTLFQLQAERLIKLQEIAAKHAGKKPSDVVIPWYIMTSPMTDKDTREYFEKENYFNINKSNIKFFEQGTLPCLTPEGKIILSNKTTLSAGPDGNGGIYMAMHSQGIVADMLKRGIKYVHTFGVDNAVVKVADPIFIGYMIEQNAEVGCKSCPKSCPEEAVGVLCKKDNKYTIVEYCELNPEIAKKRNANGNLYLNTGFICNLGYSVEFLNTTCHPDHLPRVYHLANKKIPYADKETGETVKPETPNGIKLESFIFDVFPAVNRLAAYEVNRSQEFSPVKNPPGNPVDSPDSARMIFSNNHKSWLKDAGINVKGDGLCEISPFVSYAGEGLECIGKIEIETPCLIECEKETLKKVKSLGEKINDHVHHTVVDGVNIYTVV